MRMMQLLDVVWKHQDCFFGLGRKLVLVLISIELEGICVFYAFVVFIVVRLVYFFVLFVELILIEQQ